MQSMVSCLHLATLSPASLHPEGLCLSLCAAGDAAWESKAFTHPCGFSSNGRYYEPSSMRYNGGYEHATAAAFTEDVTFLFEGLPALQELEMGCYTAHMGDEALSRKLLCDPVGPAVAEPHSTAAPGTARSWLPAPGAGAQWGWGWGSALGAQLLLQAHLSSA